MENNILIDTQIGEIQLTDYGVSGICIFCLSGRAARGLSQKKKEQLSINFLYPFELHKKEEFHTWMNARNNQVKLVNSLL